MVITGLVRGLQGGCAEGKDFLFFLASAFYTQFDTFRRGGNLQAYVPPNKIIYLDLKAAHVLAICAVGTYWWTGLGLRITVIKQMSMHTGQFGG